MHLGDPTKWCKLTDFSVGDYVRVRLSERTEPFLARVDEVLKKNVSITKRGTSMRYRVAPQVLEKIDAEQYGCNGASLLVDIPTLRQFEVGDYIRTTFRGRLVYGQVTRKLVKYISVSVLVDGRPTCIRGHPTDFIRITKQDFDDAK
jgi:hypothetical protein